MQILYMIRFCILSTLLNWILALLQQFICSGSDKKYTDSCKQTGSKTWTCWSRRLQNQQHGQLGVSERKIKPNSQGFTPDSRSWHWAYMYPSTPCTERRIQTSGCCFGTLLRSRESENKREKYKYSRWCRIFLNRRQFYCPFDTLNRNEPGTSKFKKALVICNWWDTT